MSPAPVLPKRPPTPVEVATKVAVATEKPPDSCYQNATEVPVSKQFLAGGMITITPDANGKFATEMPAEVERYMNENDYAKVMQTCNEETNKVRKFWRPLRMSLLSIFTCKLSDVFVNSPRGAGGKLVQAQKRAIEKAFKAKNVDASFYAGDGKNTFTRIEINGPLADML